ncbi:DUF4405 domain-containing protein [Neobacillus sp. PS3-34]|uniref:DUF4405 domain-containing protein n=1 Tax=Neobacillus sp. PS3-34 TaxID=3070678 RepID=UPI0027E21108|nr:DUF4405 domain-containing protein [Neobacillus sp. PS3-34]WML48870.1 DUF4405 domain-containing protein [Neobacillus sp. PS3-34]
MKKNYTKIVLDLMMAITFVLLMNPRVLNGLPFHEIAGLEIGVAILTHIGLNYRWVINTTKKIFDPNFPKKTRFNFLLNLLLLVSMATVIITGILISRVVLPSLAIQGGHLIRGIHSFSADATLALVGLHVGVHWQWIMGICKRAFKTKEGKLRNGVIASVALSIAILASGIQWFSSTASSNIDDFNPKQIQQSGGLLLMGTLGTMEIQRIQIKDHQTEIFVKENFMERMDMAVAAAHFSLFLTILRFGQQS